MALRSLTGEVSELCIAKPELKWIAATTTISDALAALKASGETYISVWASDADGSCACVGKFSTADVILFLCRDENLADPFKALQTPVYEILPEIAPIVRHVQPNSSLLEALDYIIEGTQNLVIPIQNRRINYPRKRFITNRQPSCSSSYINGHGYCWLTQEDVARFILNSIGAFSPFPTLSIESLDIIDRDTMTITYNKPASSALAYFHRAITEQKSVAVVDEENRLIGEISPSALSSCDETVASAMTALSALDLMSYIDCATPPEDLVRLVKTRLEEKSLNKMVDLMDECSHSSLLSSSCSSSSLFSCSSDDESVSGRSSGHKAGNRCEPIVCSRGSSLLAVMIQALAYRVGCVWVVEEDHTLVGAVTLAGILQVFGRFAGKSEWDDVF